MSTVLETHRLIRESLLRIRQRSPFLATLALFARIECTSAVAIATTNGQDVLLNPDYIVNLPNPQLDGLLLHEILHAALLHIRRRGNRIAEVWNIAADIVVNGIVTEQGYFALLPGAIQDPQLASLSVEEVYECLLREGPCYGLPLPDLLDNDAVNLASGMHPLQKRQSYGATATNGEMLPADDLLPNLTPSEMEAHWRHAIWQAHSVAQALDSQGYLSAGLQRELTALTQPQLDWRTYLWRYIVQTPTDFTGFDRRCVHRGLYLEALQRESVKVLVAVDTSGSISDELLHLFLAEVHSLLKAYPNVKGELYCADTQVYGPYPLAAEYAIASPVGGGGTSFIPFFEQIEQTQDGQANTLCIYLTDGHGTFPITAPSLSVLWVVTPGGLDLNQFPFGETVRLLTQA